MKDEEMAEERKADYGIDLCCICRECEVGIINPCQHKKDAMYGYKDGFLAGLKQGKPEWHDLRKDKNDLPKEPTEKMRVNETWVYVKFFDNTYGLVDKGALKNYSGAIAWCELPTFDKE